MPVEGEGREESVVAVGFGAIEIDVEEQRLVEASKRDSAALGDEAVDVARPDGEEGEVEVVVHLVAQHTLEVGVGGCIGPLGGHAVEEVAVIVEAEAQAVREPVAHPALGGGAAAEEGGRKAETAFDGTGVEDVERRGEFVAVGRVEAARGEHEVVDHVGVDDAHAFLLSAAHQLGAIDFDTVDIDEVLVERTAAHGVLGGELVVGRHVGEGLDERLDPLLGSEGVFEPFDVDLHESRGADAFVLDLHLLEGCRSRREFAVEHQHLATAHTHAELPRLIAHRGEAEGDRVGLAELETIASTGVGDRSRGRAAEDSDVYKLDRGTIGRAHFTPHNSLGLNAYRGQQKDEQSYNPCLVH